MEKELETEKLFKRHLEQIALSEALVLAEHMKNPQENCPACVLSGTVKKEVKISFRRELSDF